MAKHEINYERKKNLLQYLLSKLTLALSSAARTGYPELYSNARKFQISTARSG
jgi:hypothetical protein